MSEICRHLKVSKSSVSRWVAEIELSAEQKTRLLEKGTLVDTVERRRQTRLFNESKKRQQIIEEAAKKVPLISPRELLLLGTVLYWAEGGKTQRMVRFSNSDPELIKLMMRFFRVVCLVPEAKFRGYIHIHPHLDHKQAEQYWSSVSKIPLNQLYKTYRKPNKSSQNKKDSLPYGTFDIYVLNTKLFFKITGWMQGILESTLDPNNNNERLTANMLKSDAVV